MGKGIARPVEGLSEDTDAFFKVLNEEPDLSVVLVGTSYVDACLGALLERFLAESPVTDALLDPRTGALGTLRARSDACYSLRLIGKPLYQDLLVLGEIRNQFAHHHLELSFAIPDVAQHCLRLAYVAGLKLSGSLSSLYGEERLANPRDLFALSVVLISQQLLVAGLGVRRVGQHV